MKITHKLTAVLAEGIEMECIKIKRPKNIPALKKPLKTSHQNKGLKTAQKILTRVCVSGQNLSIPTRMRQYL
jgi:hypothetical protein